MRIKLVLAAGLTLVAIAVAVTLSRSPLHIAGTDSYSSVASIAQLGADASTHSRGLSACQAGEVMPAGTTAIQLSLSSDIGPALSVKALSGRTLLTSGSRPAGWTGVAVVVPVKHSDFLGASGFDPVAAIAWRR